MYTVHCNHQGYVALISVFVAGAVGVAVSVSLLLLGIGSSRTSFAYEQSAQAQGLVHACAEEALQHIRDANSFTGTAGLTLGQGACTYTITSQGGEQRIVVASSTVGTIVRKVRVVVADINPVITITSWQEVDAF